MFGGRSLGPGGPIAVLAVALTLLLSSAAQAATYNPSTQSHPGACSQNTLSVPVAVRDLNANHVLAQYARMVGVHWRRGHLVQAMRRALVVTHLKGASTTANHGCTTTGLVFAVGPRRLRAGETVGVRVPNRYIRHLCRGSHRGCRRLTLRRALVFPTNCWNLNVGRATVVIWVRRPRPKTKPVKVVKVALPGASATLKCQAPFNPGGGPGGSGTLTVVLSNAAKATLPASFTVTVSGNSLTAAAPASYGPLAPGRSLTEAIAVDASGTNVKLTVVSAGKTVLLSIFPGGCPGVTPQ